MAYRGQSLSGIKGTGSDGHTVAARNRSVDDFSKPTCCPNTTASRTYPQHLSEIAQTNDQALEHDRLKRALHSFVVTPSALGGSHCIDLDVSVAAASHLSFRLFLPAADQGSALIAAMSWVTHNINHNKPVTAISPSVSSTRRQAREKNFVLDSVAFTRYQAARKLPIIPPYDAMKDKYAVSYFQSPAVKAMAERNSLMKELYREKAMHSLITRKSCYESPDMEELQRRRENFVNDAIITDRLRTKYRDIIPPYRAEDDEHCRKYFQRKDIQKLLKITFSPNC